MICVGCQKSKAVRLYVRGKNMLPNWAMCSVECAFKTLSPIKGSTWKTMTKEDASQSSSTKKSKASK